MAVDVGLVVGRMAATTPTGVPISTTFSSGISRMMPTVFMPRMRRGSQSEVSRSEEHTSELQSLRHLVCRLLLEKKYVGRVQIKVRQFRAVDLATLKLPPRT